MCTDAVSDTMRRAACRPKLVDRRLFSSLSCDGLVAQRSQAVRVPVDEMDRRSLVEPFRALDGGHLARRIEASEAFAVEAPADRLRAASANFQRSAAAVETPDERERHSKITHKSQTHHAPHCSRAARKSQLLSAASVEPHKVPFEAAFNQGTAHFPSR